MIVPVDDGRICKGRSYKLSSSVFGNQISYDYQWRTSDGKTLSSKDITVTNEGTYLLNVTDANNCESSSSVVLSMTPAIPVKIIGKEYLCTGETVTLKGEVYKGFQPYKYEWLKDNSSSPMYDNLKPFGATTSEVSTNLPGLYRFTIEDFKGCKGEANINIKQFYSPDVRIRTSRTPALLTGESVVLSVPTASGQTYQWSKDGAAISGATNNSYTVSAANAGAYTVRVTTDGGCTVTSDAVMVSIILANEPLAEEVGLRVSPNPITSQAKILLQLTQPATAQVYITDASGRLVRTWESAGKATRHEATLDMRSVAAGSYVVQAEAGGQVFTEKLVKQ